MCYHSLKKEKQKMKLANNRMKKKTILTVTVILMLSMIVPMMTLPISTAHYPPWTNPVWCYSAVAPNNVGVGQQTLITFWCNMIPPTASTDSRYGDRWIFYVDITS